MPSIAESKKLVREGLATEPDHNAILSSLQDEIDKHNRIKSDTEKRVEKRKRKASKHSVESDEHRSDLRFRFKANVDGPRQRRSEHRRKHRSKKHDESYSGSKSDDTSHPFPREPVSEFAEQSDDAFLTSLLDALADDEAAAYWESVYNQPIHTFSRPSVRTETGALEQMDDEEYASYVKRKMWERSHPEIVMERDRMEQKKREEEEGKRKRREEFVRRREREAWRRASKAKDPDGEDANHDYVFDFDQAENLGGDSRTRGEERRQHERAELAEWRGAWDAYLRAWEKLKDRPPDEDTAREPSKYLPWPVMPTKPPTKPHIEDFMRHIPLAEGRTRQHVLKAERVRWHPDKIQQRFGGQVDEGTMKVVTGVFQIIDAILEEERKRSS